MATLTSGDSVKLSSGMNGVAEKTFETWQRGLDAGKRWMRLSMVTQSVFGAHCSPNTAIV